MKIGWTMVLMLLSAVAMAQEPSPGKVRVAVVRLDRLMNNEYGDYDRLRLSTADREIVRALKNIDTEIRSLQKELVGVEDEIKLAEMGKRIEFLNRKSALLRQRVYNQSVNMQQIARDFVIKNYKDQYSLIAPDTGAFDRFLYKGNLEIHDISDEAAAKFHADLMKRTDP